MGVAPSTRRTGAWSIKVDGSPSVDRKLGNQQNGDMKTTLDLPDDLVKLVKLRALQEGRKLKDAAADLLRKGLAAAANQAPDDASPVVARDKETGLPLIQCKQAASPQDEITPERVAAILLAQETDWHHAAGVLS
jgi:plasmid stability protein